jgi:hypothetical protein
LLHNQNLCNVHLAILPLVITGTPPALIFIGFSDVLDRIMMLHALLFFEQLFNCEFAAQ